MTHAPRVAPRTSMDRLMCLHVQAQGLAEKVEVQLNGVPVMQLAAPVACAGLLQACMPVHEYLRDGVNHIGLVVGAPPPALAGSAATQPRLSPRRQQVVVRLLLTRAGRPVDEPGTLALALLEWSVGEGDAYNAPLLRERHADLPVGFARWRWFDAPPIELDDTGRQAALRFVQRVAFDLSRGRPESLLAASRLKLAELALAYQWPADRPAQALRQQVQRWWKAEALSVVPPENDELVLRPIADGRLLDCVTPLGTPVLATRNPADSEMGNTAWPLRLALVGQQIYVLR